MDVFNKYRIDPNAWGLGKITLSVSPLPSGCVVEVSDVVSITVAENEYSLTFKRSVKSQERDDFHFEVEYNHKGKFPAEYGESIEKDLAENKEALFYWPSSNSSLLLAQATAQMLGHAPLILPAGIINDSANEG